MNCISKAILLSAVGLCVDSGSLTFASTQIPLSIPKKSGISTLHIHHTYIRHTIQRLNLSSRLFDDLRISGEEQKVASVCFITDTRKCSVDKFDNTDEPENGNGAPGSGSGETPETPEYKTPEEVCQDAGYGQTPCPEGSSPIPCPVAPNYFACSCDKKFSQKCQAPNYGVGESCGGKYQKCEEDLDRACKEENGNYVTSCPSGWQMSDTKCSFDPSYGLCCNLCNGYTYNDEKDIPEGYVKGETCVNCDNEPWFKLAPNPCDGFYDCSLTAPEIGANSCLSGTVTKYDNCKPCPNLGIYATCPTGYKCEYERCSGKYYKVDGCQDGFDWNAAAKTCTCANKGTYSSCPTGYKCEKEKCSGKYYKVDGCASGYDWNSYNKTCTCPNQGDLSSCPTGYDCNYESCSGKYYKTGRCSSGYELQGSVCICPNECSLSSCPTGGICKQESCSRKYCLTSCKGYEDYEMKNGTCVCKRPDTTIGSYSNCPKGASCSRPQCSSDYYINGCYTFEGYRWNESKKTCEQFETKAEYRAVILKTSPCSAVVVGGNSLAVWKRQQLRCPLTGEIKTLSGMTNEGLFSTVSECESYKNSHIAGDNEGWEISSNDYCTTDGEFKSSPTCKGGTWNCTEYNGRDNMK